MQKKPVQERLWSKIHVGGKDDCWPWIPANGRNIRPSIRDDSGIPKLVYRLAYESKRGAIPSGMIACHTCDNPTCCNPDHIFIGTQSDNMRDMITKNRQYQGRHDWTPAGDKHYKWKHLNETRIRKEYVPGSKDNGIAALAAKYDTSPATISRILNGKRLAKNR